MTITPLILWGSMGPDSHRLDTALEKAVGKRQSLPHLALAWAYGRKSDGSLNYAPFPNVGGPGNNYSFLTDKEYPPDLPVYMDWVSWDLRNQSDPELSAENIIAGKHDAFIHQWAIDAKAFGRPVLLRFDSEFNGDWWPNFGAKTANNPSGTTPDRFVAMWQKVVGIFREEGATNVGWHWCPNFVMPAGKPQPMAADKLAAYYPLDDFVTYTGFDGYNEGSHKVEFNAAGVKTGGWYTPWMLPSEVINGGGSGWMGHTYDVVKAIAPNKPMGIGEFNSDDRGGSKATWLADFLVTVPKLFPLIRFISLFNWNSDPNAHWALGTGLTAFAQGIANNPVYAAGGTLPMPAAGAALPTYSLVPSIEPVAAPANPVPPELLSRGDTWSAVAASYTQELSAAELEMTKLHVEQLALTNQLSETEARAVALRATLADLDGHITALVKRAGLS